MNSDLPSNGSLSILAVANRLFPSSKVTTPNCWPRRTGNSAKQVLCCTSVAAQGEAKDESATATPAEQVSAPASKHAYYSCAITVC